MPLKVVLFYNQFAEGFTETYYVNTTQSPYQWIGNTTNKQLYFFVGFRHASVSLYAIRATTVGGPRQSFTYVYGGASAMVGSNPNGTQFIGPTADVSSTDAFCDLYDAFGKKRPLYVRGLNDYDVVRNTAGQSVPSSGLTNALQNMLYAMQSLGFCIQWQTRPPTNGLVWNQAFTLTGIGTGTTIALTGPVPGLVIGSSQIVFQGIQTDYMPGFPRITTPTYASAAAPWSITIPYLARFPVANVFIPNKLKFCLVADQYTAITGLTFNVFGERKTGRAFGVPRGRSRAKVRAQ